MPRKLREYVAISLISLLGSCASNPGAVEESDRILNTAPKSFIPRRAHLTEELDIYKRGPTTAENPEGY